MSDWKACFHARPDWHRQWPEDAKLTRSFIDPCDECGADVTDVELIEGYERYDIADTHIMPPPTAKMTPCGHVVRHYRIRIETRDASMSNRPDEHRVERTTSGEMVPANYRAYQGVYCPTCAAPPGEWCRRLFGDMSTRLRSLHQARMERLAALEAQWWGR